MREGCGVWWFCEVTGELGRKTRKGICGNRGDVGDNKWYEEMIVKLMIVEKDENDHIKIHKKKSNNLLMYKIIYMELMELMNFL